MPKIPTFKSRERITGEVGGVTSDISVSPFRTTGAAIAKVARAAEDYYIKERNIKEKTEAAKAFVELSSELDTIQEGASNQFDLEEANNIFLNQSQFLLKEKLSKIKNKRVKSMLQNDFDLDLIERKIKIKQNVRDRLDEEFEYNNKIKKEQNLSRYKIAKTSNEKQIIKEKLLADEENNGMSLGDSSITIQKNKDIIRQDLLVSDVEQLIENNQFETAKNILEDIDNTPYLDADKREELLNKTKEQTNVSFYYQGFKTGNDYLIGSDEDNKDTLKSIEQMAMRENFGKKNDAELFISVDQSFKNVGRLSPSYQQILKQGVLASPVNGLPTPQIVRALRIADAADQSGRLDEYVSGEEKKFYRSYLVARKVRGKTESEAYEMAVKSKDISLKLSSLPQYQRKRETTFKEIRKTYSDIKSTNLTEILSYGESLYDLYIGLGSSPEEAKDQIKKDLKNDIEVVDDYGYLKRDINPYKSIGGLEEIKPTKEFIINKYLPDEDPDDFYLTYKGAGEFAIYNREVPHTYYNDEGMPMLFNYNDMVSFKEEIKIKSKKEAKEKLFGKEISVKQRQKKLSELAEQKVKSGFGEPIE